MKKKSEVDLCPKGYGIAERLRRIRQPFKARHQQIVDSLLGSSERRAHERLGLIARLNRLTPKGRLAEKQVQELKVWAGEDTKRRSAVGLDFSIGDLRVSEATAKQIAFLKEQVERFISREMVFPPVAEEYGG